LAYHQDGFISHSWSHKHNWLWHVSSRSGVITQRWFVYLTATKFTSMPQCYHLNNNFNCCLITKVHYTLSIAYILYNKYSWMKCSLRIQETIFILATIRELELWYLHDLNFIVNLSVHHTCYSMITINGDTSCSMAWIYANPTRSLYELYDGRNNYTL